MELAHAFIRTGELTDAVDALNQQLVAHPQDDEARRLRASVLLRLPGDDQLEQALHDLSALSHKTADDYVQMSILDERLHRLEGAIQAMVQACQLAPHDERLTERLPGLYMKHGDTAAALALVQKQPRTWRWLQWEADLLLLREDFTAAAACYGQVLAQIDARHDFRVNQVMGAIRTRVLLARAYAFRRSGHYAAAKTDYDHAKRYYPDENAIDFNCGLLLALQGQVEAAAQQCRAAMQATTNPELLAEMQRTLATEPELQSLAAQLTGL
jgi:tetratricopeptide (TPR) repeat protein